MLLRLATGSWTTRYTAAVEGGERREEGGREKGREGGREEGREEGL